MDIKISSDLAATQPTAARVNDLLAQLKTAGTVEAEVVKLLQENKLLLSTRLGEILTSNKLNYKPGDRIYLRLDDRAQQPVLKTSPQPTKAIVLDSRQNPELARALPAERPMLARVSKIVAQQAEIQLAEQVLKLPREVKPVTNQLLSLRRHDNTHRIEINPLDNKAIYKAILKQLLPRQAENNSSSLIRLLNLVSATAIKPQPLASGNSAANQRPASADTTTTPPANHRAAINPPAGAASSKVQTDAGNRYPTRSVTTESTTGGHSVENATTTRASTAIRLLNTFNKGNPLPIGPQAVSSGKVVDPVPAQRETAGVGASAPKNGVLKSLTSRHAVEPGQPTPARIQAAVQTTVDASTVTMKPATQVKTPAGKAANEPRLPPIGVLPGAPVSSASPMKPGATQATAATTQGVDRAPLALQPLMQLLTRFADIDATQIRKWFEFARLIYPPKTEPAAVTPPDIFRVLKQLSDGEILSRELSQASQQGSRSGDGDAATSRSPAEEALLRQVREGVKLVEQSLSQNLHQRASLGLQQETQQPLTLSLALPFVEEQEAKPLYIDLAQRNQAQEESDKSWDIRLCFELGNLGSISCHLVLEGRTIAASFYSALEQTRSRIETELPQLRQQLTRAGFTPGEFHSFPGKAAPARTPNAADYAESLIDIEV